MAGIGTALAFAVGLADPSPAEAQQRVLGTHGYWTAQVDGTGPRRVCYIGSAPQKAEGNYTRRGDTHVLVTHRPADKVKGEVSVTAGYTYREGSEVSVDIDGKTFKLFTRGGNAWAADAAADRVLVSAMKAGNKMVIRGTSSRGTLTTDTYSLRGFTAAHNAIDKACAA
jgi:invasion protein IalB